MDMTSPDSFLCRLDDIPDGGVIGVNPPDGSPAALVDDIQVQYRPDLSLEQTECVTPDGPIDPPDLDPPDDSS